MNFFEHQDRARSQSTKLIVLFVIAVILVCLSVYGAVMLGLHYAGAQVKMDDMGRSSSNLLVEAARGGWWHAQIFAYSTGATLIMIGLGSAMKIGALQNGASVASSLGGRLVSKNNATPPEATLLNVVEEMAIASGVPVPLVFVMDAEEAINAFAAGFTPDDAVIGVTRGCIQKLNRDELQGVIAHEFSHILNGDMKLNLRIIGVLYGIMILGLIGRTLLRAGFYSGGGRRRRGKDDSAAGIAIAGLALLIIGSVGVFFGRIIKAAISRQREFLADASAVQFTRNPKGIGGALKKIGGFTDHAKLQTSAAEETSHMFFGDAISRMVDGHLLATHPPLGERIRRIEPEFDDDFEGYVNASRAAAAGNEVIAGFAGSSAEQAVPVARDATGEVRRTAAQVMGTIGTIAGSGTAAPETVLKRIPPGLLSAVQDPYGASVVVLALLIDNDERTRGLQLNAVRECMGDAVLPEITQVMPAIDELPEVARLPLVDVAIPALRQMTATQYEAFSECVEKLIAADEAVTIFEFSLRTILVHRLARSFTKARRETQHFSFASLMQPVQLLLSAIALSGAKDPSEAAAAFKAGVNSVQNARVQQLTLLHSSQVQIRAMDGAIEALALAAPKIKQQIVEAAAHCVLADQRVTPREAELLRAVSRALDCPMPPIG